MFVLLFFSSKEGPAPHVDREKVGFRKSEDGGGDRARESCLDSSLWERTCTLSQVSVITILLSGGYIFQRSSRPLEQFWLTLWYTSDRERESAGEEEGM